MQNIENKTLLEIVFSSNDTIKYLQESASQVDCHVTGQKIQLKLFKLEISSSEIKIYMSFL